MANYARHLVAGFLNGSTARAAVWPKNRAEYAQDYARAIEVRP